MMLDGQVSWNKRTKIKNVALKLAILKEQGQLWRQMAKDKTANHSLAQTRGRKKERVVRSVLVSSQFQTF